MQTIIKHLSIAVFLLSALSCSADEENILAPGAKLQKLASGFSFTEGPTCDSSGNVFFTDQPNNRILKWDAAEKKLTTFLQPAGRANGMYFDATGHLIACADEKTALWSISTNGQHTILFDQYENKSLNGPNDVWVHPNGGIYVTDPFYKRSWWNYEKRPQDGEHVYYLAPGSKVLKRVITDLRQPNGIIGTPDGKKLFVADIGDGKTFAYDIQSDGSLVNKQLRCPMGSDGMTLDKAGNLYLTGKGVTVFDPAGKKIAHIDVPCDWTANVSFGGKDHRTLFITAGDSFYSIDMLNAGANASK